MALVPGRDSPARDVSPLAHPTKYSTVLRTLPSEPPESMDIEAVGENLSFVRLALVAPADMDLGPGFYCSSLRCRESCRRAASARTARGWTVVRDRASSC